PAYESDPLWTRDGSQVVFSSTREGSKDIFVVAAGGGLPERLTDYPGSETPKAVLPDGSILFQARLQQDTAYDGFPGDQQLYRIVKGESRPRPVTSLPISEISVSPQGLVLYEDYKGYEDPFRKHHTSSVTRDIWLYRGTPEKIDANGTFTRLSTFAGEDRNPVFAADGKTFYYLSEQDGKTLNVFRSQIDAPAPVRLTAFDKDPVRYLSVSDNGLLAFSQNGELYTLREGEQPKKLEISILRDEVERDMQIITFTGNASAMSVSPDGKEIAVVIRGDVFVTSTDYKTTRRITNTPEQERGVSFSEDGRALYYAAERGGCWSIYRTVLTEKKEKMFTYATALKEERFSAEGETCFQPIVSPDGKQVAYLRDRTELVIQPTKGGQAKSLLKDANYSYQDGDQSFAWSPDSRYLLCNYQADGGWNNVDVAMIDTETGEVTDLTRSGYDDGAFRWALNGKAMTWESDKYGYRSHGSWGAHGDLFIMFFDPKAMTEFAWDKEDEEVAKMLAGEKEKKKDDKKDSTDKKKPEKLKPVLEGRENRIVRLTRMSTSYGDHYLTQDGKKLYYITPLESGRGLCEMDVKKGDIKVIQRGVMGSIVPSPDDKYLYLFSGGGISKISTAGGKVEKISFSGDYEFKPKAERTYMFDHIWKQVKEKFYDPGLHGVDWQYCYDNYSRFLPYINNYYDFQEMLSEMLGELNGSHTGARFYARDAEAPAYLGVLFDMDWTGDGARIAEVLPDGVLNLADPEIKAGDIIEAIGGTPILAGDNWMSLLAGKAGKKITLQVKKGGKSVQLLVKPSSSDAALLYRRWVRQREQIVEKLSGGKVGYVHVEGMDSPSFREVYSNALGKYRGCEALIVDTRHNGGGWLHDDLATFLGGQAYIRFTPRGQYIGTEPYSKWTKPSCVLVCEDNYSDASGFPYVYRNLGLGKLIGAPVPGTMTAVWWERQINSSIVFGIPQVGSWGIKEGRYLENFQLEPDILVYNTPAEVLSGTDKQLEAAVQEMLKEIEHGQ
ncbi:MAG: PD40 domain-containing protein, partial [Bacteroidales bacterium]|nr:PD40 domain-containing protein [Bacteroidales bacterium]